MVATARNGKVVACGGVWLVSWPKVLHDARGVAGAVDTLPDYLIHVRGQRRRPRLLSQRHKFYCLFRMMALYCLAWRNAFDDISKVGLNLRPDLSLELSQCPS